MPTAPDDFQYGDVNLNDRPYEIADAVLYANYFVYGESVFIKNPELQILASDVNRDGRTCTISDNLKLIRYLDGEEIPYNDTDIVVLDTPEECYLRNSNGIISIDSSFQLGGILFVIQGKISPVQMSGYRYHYEDQTTRVLFLFGHNDGIIGFLIDIGDHKILSVDISDTEGNYVKPHWIINRR